MYWTRLVLVWPAAEYSAIPLKHHATGRQGCPNPDNYPDFKPANRSLILMCWAISRAAEPQILTSFFFFWRGRGSEHQHPTCQANAQSLHYPSAVAVSEIQGCQKSEMHGMAANGTWTLNSQKYTLNTYTHAEVRMLVRFVVWLAVSEVKGRQKSEMQGMSPNWTWTLNSQKYSLYTTYLLLRPEFWSVLLYD